MRFRTILSIFAIEAETQIPDVCRSGHFRFVEYKNLKEEDYHIEYYFNGELLLNINFIDFKNKINELVWSSNKINNFCKHKDANILDHMFYFSLSGSIFIILISIIRTKKAAERLKNLSEDKF